MSFEDKHKVKVIRTLIRRKKREREWDEKWEGGVEMIKHP